MEFDREKFKRLLHYVIARAGKRDGFGATKLYKVLWFSEARHYVLHGRPITGAVYIREKFGPVPRLGMPIREELAREGAIRQWRNAKADKMGWCMVSLREPQMVGFTDEELQTIHYWIKHIDEDHTAATISELSHDDAWEIARMGEPLPLFSQLATRMRKPTEEELERARKVAADLKLT
jgi:hypothetical protein